MSDTISNNAATSLGGSDVSSVSSTEKSRDLGRKGMAESLRNRHSATASAKAGDETQVSAEQLQESNAPSAVEDVKATDLNKVEKEEKKPDWKKAHDDKHYQLKQAKQQLNDKDLQIKQLTTAVELLEKELRSKLEMLSEHNLFDEKDYQLNMYSIQDEYSKAQQQLYQEHQQLIAQQQQQQVQAQYQQQYKQQISEAVQKYPLTSFKEVRDGMLAVFEQNPNITAEEVAAKIHEDRLIKARPYYEKIQTVPQTVSRPGISAGFKRTNDAKGMAAWLKQQGMLQQ